ncbi:MAG: HAMP domain-containing sensor histidine kinase, partial [Gemmatimonadales bacterium]
MASRKLAVRLRRFGPAVVLVLVASFAAVSIWQWWVVADHLRAQARATSNLYGQVTAALADPSPDAGAEALLAIVPDVTRSGIPIVVTDETGFPTMAANLPDDLGIGDPALAAYVSELDRMNDPIDVPGSGRLHFGRLPVSGLLTRLGFFQVGLLLAALAVGFWAYRSAMRSDRDRLWVAMARESAHQLGTPLMSAEAWVDRLSTKSTPPEEIARHLKDDLDRLHRVARRFERVGRPAKQEHVALGAVAERVAGYFQPRLPRHANAITITVEAPTAGPFVVGDPVLIEWALEALVRNALDALSGRGGRIHVSVEDAGARALVRVADDGPGVSTEVRANLFEPGVSTTRGGWGIGLALARRIFEGVHSGRLRLEPAEKGAVFVAEIPVAP